MSGMRLTPEQQKAVCEDLLAIKQADRLRELNSLRRQMLSEHRSPIVWQQIAANQLAHMASSFIGGSPDCWRDAAAAAVGICCRVDVCVEAVCRVADDVRRHEEPERREEQRQAAPRARLSIGSRKRGRR